MWKQIFLLGLAVFLIQACGSGSNETNKIDYATIDSLQTEVVMEIGETEDYLPGQLTSLVVTPNDDILVADWASKTIEQFDSEGNHITTIAEGGGGPGEMSDFFLLNKMGNDTLLVNQVTTGQKDFFVPGPDGTYQFLRSDKPVQRPERSFTIIGAQSDTSYYATTDGIFSFNFNEGEQKDYKSSAMVVINSSGEVLQDSVQMYKTANLYTERSGNSIRAQDIPFRFEDNLAMVGNGDYLVARVDSNAIYRYNSNHELVKKIPLNVAERPITSDDLSHALGEELEPGTRNELEARIGDYKPPYLNVYATKDYIWLHTNTSEAGKEMVVIDYEGNPVGKFMLPEVDSIQEIEGQKVYVIHRSPEQGDMIRVYRVNI